MTAFPAFTSPGARRGWRVYQNVADGGGAIMALSECHFMSGGVDISGTIVVSGTSGGSTADLVDNNTGTFWYHFDVNAWVAIDCGVGMSSTLEQIRMCSRVDGFASQAPFDWEIQWTDDDPANPAAVWTRSVTFEGTHWEAAGLGFWKLFEAEPYIVRVRVESSQVSGGAIFTLGQLEFRDAPAGADLTSPQTASEAANGAIVGNAPAGGGSTPAAFNNAQNSGSYCGNQGLDGKMEFRFAADPAVVELTMQTRDDGVFYVQAPEGFWFGLSRDGVTFNETAFGATLPWTYDQIQTFDVGPSNAEDVELSNGRITTVLSAEDLGPVDLSQSRILVIYNFPSESVEVSNGRSSGVVVFGTTEAEVSQARTLAIVRGRIANPRLRVWTFTLDGHDFYVLRLGDTETLIYDLYSKQWVDWGNFEKLFWRANNGQNWIGATALADEYGSNVLVGDDTFGLLWFLDPDQAYDEPPDYLAPVQTEYFDRIVMGQVAIRGREVLPCYACWITSDMGDPAYVGAGVTLLTSDDAGATFDDHGLVSITVGENSPELSWYSLGQIGAPGRLFKITDDGAIARIDGLQMNDPDDGG